MPHPSIDVYSTVARDVVIDASHDGITTRIGGPATFIVAAFEKQGIEADVHTGPVIDVRITVDAKGETGSVEAVAQNANVPTCRSGRAIVSTLFREWDVRTIADACNEIYLDVQGFVREPNAFGRKQTWDGFEGGWIGRVRCLKATEDELRYLPTDSVEDQKTRMLLITKGSTGVEAHINGTRHMLVPSRVISARDTIGAGDTFFANVVARLLLGDAPEQAVTFALEATTRFLEEEKTADVPT